MTDYAAAQVTWGASTKTLLELTKQALVSLKYTDIPADDIIGLWLDLSGRACEQYIDNKIVLQDVVENYGMSQTPISLRYYPAKDISSLLIDGVDEMTSWELMTTDGITYALSSRYNSSKVDYFNQLTIVYSAGYDPVPSDLGYAIVLTAIAYGKQTSGTETVKKEVITGVGSVEYAVSDDRDNSVGLIASSSTQVLNLYRRYHV